VLPIPSGKRRRLTPTSGTAQSALSFQYRAWCGIRFRYIVPKEGSGSIAVCSRRDRVVMLCFDTAKFRRSAASVKRVRHLHCDSHSCMPSLRIARDHVTVEDAAIEIGSSYGRCTSILAQATGSSTHVLGVETSREVVSKASETYPALHFEQMDVFKERLRLIELKEQVVCGTARAATASAAASAAESAVKADDTDSREIPRDLCVFVDIGGNRELETLVALIPWVQTEMRPRLLVVKSQVTASVRDSYSWGWML
jgi:hypothetical protein